MPLNSSGPLSLGGSTVGQSINLELGQSATALASINASNFRTLAGVATGQISISNFYGKSNVPPTFFGSSSTTNASVYKTCFAPSGNVYTIGYIVSGNSMIVTKLNSSGTEQWTRTLGFAPFSSSYVGFSQMDVQEDSSSNVYVVLGAYFYKFDSAGTNQFNKVLSPTSVTGFTGNGISAKIDTSGNVYLAVTYGTFGQYALAKFDNTGAAVWSTYIASVSPSSSNGTSSGNPAPGFDSSGNVYAVMYGYTSGAYRSYIVKVNSSGAVQTIKAVLGMIPYGLEVTSNGSVAIVGNGLPAVGNAVMYFDSSLTLQWCYKSNAPYEYGFNSITLGPSNGIIATTIASGTTGYAYQRAIVSFSSTGSINFSSAISAPSYQPFDSITPVGDGASSLSLCSPGNTQYTQTQGQYFAMRIKNDGSQLYSYYILSPRSAGSIIMGAQSITVTSTLASVSVSTATWTTSASTAASSNAGLSIGSSSVGLTTITNLDTVTGGQAAYAVPGTYTWVCPSGVTSVSAVAVGGGSGGTNSQYGGAGSGGGLGYINNYSVTSGTSYNVIVGSGGSASTYGSGGAGGDSYFVNTSTVRGLGATASSGGSYVGTGGGVGGNSGSSLGGGGGAGGYGGNGGGGGNVNNSGVAGSNGAAGGGGGSQQIGSATYGGYGGGGVSLLGRGNSGQGGDFTNNTYTGGSGGGSNPVNLIGGTFGGAGWSGYYNVSGPCCCVVTAYSGGPGRDGAVRIIWPGNTRTFPSTNTQTP